MNLLEPSDFVFSPAVCPSRWTAYAIGVVRGTSTANCCPRYVFLTPELRVRPTGRCVLRLTSSAGSHFERLLWACSRSTVTKPSRVLWDTLPEDPNIHDVSMGVSTNQINNLVNTANNSTTTDTP
ncbi:hypothetical protein B0T14DRAFT_530977 [Immersiella caudata]|uniref:Uncharacterized protein n=1 Tax=Immersiella caudata TaxID=314043 RepID=A0AA39U640_9PEZI|nr:hypothetical protein B0T14DRAFT_530977 [Immersiella caudata]